MTSVSEIIHSNSKPAYLKILQFAYSAHWDVNSRQSLRVPPLTQRARVSSSANDRNLREDLRQLQCCLAMLSYQSFAAAERAKGGHMWAS